MSLLIKKKVEYPLYYGLIQKSKIDLKLQTYTHNLFFSWLLRQIFTQIVERIESKGW